jgi:methyl-accepting chemotaxis protein
MIISHRMAGPVFRIRKTLLAMSEGELQDRIQLRKKDDFKSLAEAVNTLNNSLKTTVDQLRTVYGTLLTDDELQRTDALRSFHGILSRFDKSSGD